MAFDHDHHACCNPTHLNSEIDGDAGRKLGECLELQEADALPHGPDLRTLGH